MEEGNNQFITHRVGLLFGFAGILGSIALFTGDMLIFYRGDETNIFANMGLVSEARITGSAICGLLAGWLYTLGAGQVYYAFQPAKRWARLGVFFSFASVMILYGVIHGAYIAIATSSVIANQLGLDVDLTVKLAVDINNTMRLLAYPFFAAFTILFIVFVWKKATLYPRWVILFSPAIPFLFSDLVANSLDGRFFTIIAGAYLNIMLFLFFGASTIALWKKQKEK